jgi:hypothetical protein
MVVNIMAGVHDKGELFTLMTGEVKGRDRGGARVY